jgi:hypothetical protein
MKLGIENIDRKWFSRFVQPAAICYFVKMFNSLQNVSLLKLRFNTPAFSSIGSSVSVKI